MKLVGYKLNVAGWPVVLVWIILLATVITLPCVADGDPGNTGINTTSDQILYEPGNGESVDAIRASISVLAQLVSKFPDQPIAKQAMVKIGTITLWNLGKPEEARTILTDLQAKAETLGLDESELAYHLAYCDYVEMNYTGARTEFQAICNAYPDSSFFESALYMVGDCSVRVSDYESAKSAFNKVISNFPDTALAASAQERLASLVSLKKQESKPSEEPAGISVAKLEDKGAHVDAKK